MAKNWLALNIGNSRLHWAWLTGETLRQTWETPHLKTDQVRRLIKSRFNFEESDTPRSTPIWETSPELWIASVVSKQAKLWETYPQNRTIELAQIPLQNAYPTLGVDRALAVWGAIVTHGSPILVVDGGTALTFTAAEGQRFAGGAILPGLQLQFRALGQATSALPVIDQMTLPDRWAMTTIEAIQSGILHTVLSGIHSFIDDWQKRFPQSRVIFTGGDSLFLSSCFHQQWPDLANQIVLDENLWIWGLRSLKHRSV